MSRLRVLAIAYACGPDRGSEFGVGWGWVNAIAANHDITVITADFNATDLDRHCRKRILRDNPRFIFVKNRAWHYRPQGLWLAIENSLAKPLMNLAYQDWLRCAYAVARQETERKEYDLVHLITYVGWRFPGKFYQLNLPFVWGPIGGLMNTPYRLLPALGLKGALYYAGRNLINSLQIKFLQGPRRALHCADGAVIAATSEIQASLLKHFGTASKVICEVGLPNTNVAKVNARQENEPMRICWSGLHLPGKALHLLLHALANISEDMRYRLHILGDGPSNCGWRNLAIRLGLNEHCQWHGQLPRGKALAVMKDCHVFVITSLKDLTSTVVVEAIALGLPVVCLDHCGFGDLISNTCGIKIRPRSIEQIVYDLKNALLTLYNNEYLRYELANGAVTRSQDYSWNNKMTVLDEMYRRATGKGSVSALSSGDHPDSGPRGVLHSITVAHSDKSA